MKASLSYTNSKFWDDIYLSTYLDPCLTSSCDNSISDKTQCFNLGEQYMVDPKNNLYLFYIITKSDDLVMIINKCPILKQWLLHILTQNQIDKSLYNWVFIEMWDIGTKIEEVRFKTQNLIELSKLNLWTPNNWNSFFKFSE